MRLLAELTWSTALRASPTSPRACALGSRCSEHVLCASRRRRPAMRNAQNAGSMLLLFLSLLSVTPAAARPDADSGEKVYQRTLKSTVWVLSPEGKRLAQGTGS